MKNNEVMGKEDEIDLRDIFLIFIKRKWWFIGSVIIILIAGLLYTFLTPSNYLLTYQIELNEQYNNNSLSELYPNYASELNHVSLANVPVIFKSVSVFKSLEGIDKDIYYNKLLEPESEVVRMSLNENTSIFNVSVAYPDYELADRIAKTLIDAFEKFIKNKGEMIFNKLLEKIEIDIGDLKDENNNYKNTVIESLEDEIDSLYLELDKYIVDYNVGLSDELEKNKNSENVSFYNVIIPPNDISYKISKLEEEISLYRKKILENESKIIELNNLREGLLKDEDVILDRVSLLSETPFHSVDSNRIRNLAIVLALSIIAGVIVVFVVNFLQGLRDDKAKRG
jgi:capsular polysaccharide biosynthesis protein